MTTIQSTPGPPVILYKVYAADPENTGRVFMYKFYEEGFLDFCHDMQMVPVSSEFYRDKWDGYWYVKPYLDL